MVLIAILILVGIVTILKQNQQRHNRLFNMSEGEIEELKSAYDCDMSTNAGKEVVNYKFSEKGKKYQHWLSRNECNPEIDCGVICSGIFLLALMYKLSHINQIVNTDRFLLTLIVSAILCVVVGYCLGVTIVSWVIKKMKFACKNAQYWVYCIIISTGASFLVFLLYDYYMSHAWEFAD